MTQTTKPLPTWLANTIRPLPPLHLRAKALPLWTNAERTQWEPAGMVWDRDGQRWV
jgi:hypothetical protein